MTKKLLIFVITIFMTATVSGQSDSSLSMPIHQIGIFLGGIHYQERDDIVAPLRWEGFGFVGGFSYSLICDIARHDIELRIPVAFLSNRYNHENKVGEINFGYSYLHRIAGQIFLSQFTLVVNRSISAYSSSSWRSWAASLVRSCL